jgi:TonB-dependent starch-binding outer membrane protein SusC
MKKLTMLGIFLLTIAGTIFGQTQIKGRVLYENGTPVKGGSVTVKGSLISTATNDQGVFTIAAKPADILQISFVGYETIEVAATEAMMEIKLKESGRLLSDVVVVGYGTQRRKSVTGAISRVTPEEITALPVTDARQALQGRVPGLSVVNNGSPGESPIIRIRGIGSISYSSDPFYVIDGMPGGDLAIIDSRDIEAIDVLRDASAAAIYGSRAANGVVMVTTKKGKRDSQLHINLDSYYGSQTAWKKLDLLNTDEYIKYATALKDNAGSALPSRFSALDDPIYAGATQTYRQTNTDWQDEMFRNAPIAQTNLSLNNGNDKGRYYASIGLIDQKGILIGTQYKRLNARFNSELNINKRISIGQTLTIANEFKLNDQNGGGRTQLKHIIHNVPYIPVKDPTLLGGYRGPDGKDGSDPQNPVRIALQDLSKNRALRVLATGYVDVSIIKGLKYRFMTGVDFISFTNKINEPIYNESFNARALNRVQEAQTNGRSLYLSNQLTYDVSLKDHHLKLLAVAESQEGRYRNLQAGGTYTTNELTGITNGVKDPGVNGGLYEDLLYSYIGRLNYDYNDKYLLSASIRRDGFSGFAPGKKWGNFPSVSAGWRISEERFLRNSKLISELKIRGSWGKMGFNGIGSYAWQPVLQQNAAPILGGGRESSAYTNALGNRNLGWETTEMTNIGLDVGLLNNALQFQLEYYKRKTTDLIFNQPLTPSLGIGNATPANVGSMENSGFEFQGMYSHTSGKLSWSVSANLATTANKVLSFGKDQTAPIFAGSNADYGGFDITRTKPGESIQNFYGFKTDGIFQSQKEIDDANGIDGNSTTKFQANAKPGDIRFKDVNGDGAITSEDRVNLGSFLPDFSYGVNFTANIKGFDFTMFWQGVQGNKVYNGTKVLSQGMLRLFGAGKEVLNAWTPTNTNTDIPRAVDGDPNNNSRTSDRFLENGSYLRLKILSVGYTLKGESLRTMTKGTVKSLRFYLSTQNLLTLTKYTGYDPEIGSRFNQALTSGIDYGQFPQARTILVGLQAGF